MRLEKERKGIDRLIAAAVMESEAKAADQLEALKEESERAQKELTATVARLQQALKGKEAVNQQLREHLQQYHEERERLKGIEKKWLEQEQRENAKAMMAEEQAKARQQQAARKAPLLQPLSPQQSQPPQGERKNLTPGR